MTFGFDAIDNKFKRPLRIELECIECGSTENIEMRPKMTAYHWEGTTDDPNDPNAPWPGCPACADAYREMMEQQWSEYYSGRLL